MEIDKVSLKRQIQSVKHGGNIQGDSFEAKIVRQAMGAVANQKGRRKLRGDSQRMNMLKNSMQDNDSSELLSMLNELGGRKNKKVKRQIAQSILNNESKNEGPANPKPKLAPVLPISVDIDSDDEESKEKVDQLKKNRNRKKKEKQRKKAKAKKEDETTIALSIKKK